MVVCQAPTRFASRASAGAVVSTTAIVTGSSKLTNRCMPGLQMPSEAGWTIRLNYTHIDTLLGRSPGAGLRSLHMNRRPAAAPGTTGGASHLGTETRCGVIASLPGAIYFRLESGG